MVSLVVGELVNGADAHPNILLSGVPEDCIISWLNGEWTYIGETVDTRPYYERFHDNLAYYIFYDKACDGGEGNFHPGWIIAPLDDPGPSTTAKQDLDEDGKCTVTGHTGLSVTGTNSTTPPSGAWSLLCDNVTEFTELSLTLTTMRIVLSGVPEDCHNGRFNGEWTYVGKTADGWPYYKWSDADADEGELRFLMFYDAECDGDAGELFPPMWAIDDIEPTALRDLDGDGKCMFLAAKLQDTVQSNTFTTPQSGVWKVLCNDAWSSLTLALAPDCPTTPDFTYVWGAWTPQKMNGSTCGGQDRREAVEGCAARVECEGPGEGCKNRQSTTQTREQAACTTTISTTTTTTTSVTTTATSMTPTTSSTFTTTTISSSTITTTTITSVTTTTKNEYVKGCPAGKFWNTNYRNKDIFSGETLSDNV
jgi:hypothetical protein